MSKWTEICSQGCSTEISHGMGQSVIFQASCVCCNLLYMSNGKGIITKVTSACPLRKEVTLLPSPFCVRLVCIWTNVRESWRIFEFSSRCDMLPTLASTSSSLACLAHLFTSSLSSVTGSQDRETCNAKISSIFPFHCQLFLRKSISLGPSPDLRLPGSPNGSLRKKMLIPFSFPKTKLSHQYAPSLQQG